MDENKRMSLLEKDFEYAEKHKFLYQAIYPEKHLLIHDATFVACFDTYNAAADEGIRRYGRNGIYSVIQMTDKKTFVL